MTVAPGETRLGWIGTGVMGASMCRHLLKRGFAVTVFNRTRTKAEPLVAAGARWADSPRGVAEAADVVFTLVGFPADVREVVLGPNGGSGRQQVGKHSGRYDDQRSIAGGRNRRASGRARRDES